MRRRVPRHRGPAPDAPERTPRPPPGVGACQRWVRRERWTIGILPFGIAELLERGALAEPRWIAGQPVDRCCADPFPLRRVGDRVDLLIETYRSHGGPGRITEVTLDPD